ASGASRIPLPGFLIAFIIIVIINSSGLISPIVTDSMVELSRWCLVVAMVGLGMKASIKELAAMGWKQMLLMVAETIFLAVLVTIGLIASR
ncbi:MAG: putative sulfate exporter family transporter, partial [Oceanospirillaceae bacterium]|nr:putative sulfate exporter family transporter [Oceanospirillaceae bacterium]